MSQERGIKLQSTRFFRNYWFVIGGIVFTIILSFVLFLWCNDVSILSIMNIIILWITFLALLWYTWETSRLRKVSEHQMRLSLSPYIQIQLVAKKTEITHYSYLVKLINLGSGIALDIEIEPQPELLVQMEKIKFLKAGESAEHYLNFKRIINNNIITTPDFEYSFSIIYKDIDNQRYLTSCKLMLQKDKHDIHSEVQRRLVD